MQVLPMLLGHRQGELPLGAGTRLRCHDGQLVFDAARSSRIWEGGHCETASASTRRRRPADRRRDLRGAGPAPLPAPDLLARLRSLGRRSSSGRDGARRRSTEAGRRADPTAGAEAFGIEAPQLDDGAEPRLAPGPLQQGDPVRWTLQRLPSSAWEMPGFVLGGSRWTAQRSRGLIAVHHNSFWLLYQKSY